MILSILVLNSVTNVNKTWGGFVCSFEFVWLNLMKTESESEKYVYFFIIIKKTWR